VFTDEEEVTATRISDGGKLGRHTDNGRQGAARSGDEGWIPGTGVARMSIECKGEERRKARGSFTCDELRATDNVSAAELQKGDDACARMGGAECEQVRKGRVGDDARLLYRQRGEKGKRGRGRRPAHLPLMVGDAACIKKERKGETERIWRGNGRGVYGS
jgi:hypothetical protein